jgi:MFS family permease
MGENVLIDHWDAGHPVRLVHRDGLWYVDMDLTTLYTHSLITLRPLPSPLPFPFPPMPALTAASPYLLELGLSKSWMSLVFMAGPLSGLIVQPLIGVLADRSRSRLGRRRPFMLAGAFICAFAIMLLGWAQVVANALGAGSRLAIAFAVFAIYLIDFSINAVMSADRALVVDTLPPEKQEEGSAYGGRMFACGSVAGFFV